MNARLIAKTTGAFGTEYEGKTIDEIIVGIARLSSSRDTNTLFEEPHKLLRHCIINGHWSVFTTANLVIEVETSRAIGREYLRHYSLSPQEFCVAGDTKISLVDENMMNCTKTIKDLFYEELQDYKVLCYNPITKSLTNSTIKYVYYNGEKLTYKVKLNTGHEIICTQEHKFFTGSIFEPLKNLIVGSRVFVNTIELIETKIISIEEYGVVDVYDIEVDTFHNYFANNILVHNSQRYQSVNVTEEIELRAQSKNNRQSSSTVINPEIEGRLASELVANNLEETFDLYEKLLSNNVSRETARFILPEATQTKIIFNGNIRSWITTLNQRLHKTAQKEARDLANVLKDIFMKECPLISKSLFNFENAENIHILDRLILEKYQVYDKLEKK